jgi:hypothetical protein
MKPLMNRSSSLDDPAAAAMIASNPFDHRRLLRLLQCRLLHRAEWQYLGTHQDTAVAPWPIDSYRCDRCERAWDKVT